MSTTPAEMGECPMCEQRTAKRHCDDPGANCTMVQCINKTCLATLDWRRRLGHRIMPGGLIDRITRMVPRQRLVRHPSGEWGPR